MIGIVLRLSTVFYTGVHDETFGDGSDEYKTMIYIVIILEHMVIMSKLILQVSANQEPSWVTEQKRNIEIIKKKINNTITLDVQEQKLKDLTEQQLAFDCMEYINSNPVLLELLIPKLKEGTEIYQKDYKEAKKKERLMKGQAASDRLSGITQGGISMLNPTGGSNQSRRKFVKPKKVTKKK